MRDCFGRTVTYLRLSVTELCNLRCRYCMPTEGVCKRRHDEMLTEEEMIMAVEVAQSLGIRKVRITGGEPLVKRNIVSICQHVAAIRGIEDVAITTNGLLLPQFAHPLKDAGVQRVNISLDTLDPEKYKYITRIGELRDALRGVKAALDTGFQKVKINVVLMKGFNDDEIEALARLTRIHPVDVRFIEWMPMASIDDDDRSRHLPVSAVLETLPSLSPQPHDGGVARLYRLPGALGNVGLISPVSHHFCRACNRLRLTADGKIKPCLHSPDEYAIKGLDRERMREQFIRAIRAKPEQHAPLFADHRSEAHRAMYQIGG
ncbi:MAG: GTP 3',8-cyclase MoaA [Saccharofermentanales bacterium]|jgi:cyclic pyranopterin phosphate synthase